MTEHVSEHFKRRIQYLEDELREAKLLLVSMENELSDLRRSLRSVPHYLARRFCRLSASSNRRLVSMEDKLSDLGRQVNLLKVGMKP